MKCTDVTLKYYKEEKFNIYDAMKRGIRVGLASVIDHFYVNCKNKQINPEHTGKENYLKLLDFNSLYSSAIVQVLANGEISVCSKKNILGLAHITKFITILEILKLLMS